MLPRNKTDTKGLLPFSVLVSLIGSMRQIFLVMEQIIHTTKHSIEAAAQSVVAEICEIAASGTLDEILGRVVSSQILILDERGNIMLSRDFMSAHQELVREMREVLANTALDLSRESETWYSQPNPSAVDTMFAAVVQAYHLAFPDSVLSPEETRHEGVYAIEYADCGYNHIGFVTEEARDSFLERNPSERGEIAVRRAKDCWEYGY